jgi:hypothetical protein
LQAFQYGAIEGVAIEGVAIELPLRYEGRLVGSLSVGPRDNGRPYSEDEVAALEQAAEVLAYLLFLMEGRRSTDDMVEAKIEARRLGM